MRVLVDTVIWVDFWSGITAAKPLRNLLADDGVATHSAVRGELSLANYGQRSGRLAALALLPHLAPVDDEEVRTLIDRRSLVGSGIGWVDAHLVAAALVRGARLWTRDRGLLAVVTRLKIGWSPGPH